MLDTEAPLVGWHATSTEVQSSLDASSDLLGRRVGVHDYACSSIELLACIEQAEQSLLE